MKVSPDWRPRAPGSHPRKWSKERFSIITTTMWSIPEAAGEGSDDGVVARAGWGWATEAATEATPATAVAPNNARRVITRSFSPHQADMAI